MLPSNFQLALISRNLNNFHRSSLKEFSIKASLSEKRFVSSCSFNNPFEWMEWKWVCGIALSIIWIKCSVSKCPDAECFVAFAVVFMIARF